MNMKIDKKNGNVNYCDETHTYWKDGTDEKYISVTTLIGRFEADFDKEFWSKYKGLERLLGKEKFKLEKSKLLKTKRFDNSILATYDITESEFNKTVQDILDEWDKKNRESCERGTKIHAQLEAYAKGGKFKEKIVPNLGRDFNDYKCYVNPDTNELVKSIDRGILPEYLVYRESDDGILKIAGQIDLLIKDGNDIWVADYKSNQKIDLKSGFDTATKKSAKMKYPLNNLDDCNYIHYTLQLSTYAWMLQKVNPDYNIKGLILVHFDHEGNITTYQLDYLKDDVERMLAYYKTMRKKEIAQERRKRIEF